MSVPLPPARAEAVLRVCLDGFEDVRLSVSGDCMAPQAEPGARVRLVAAARRPARFGDVVLTRTPAGLRLHRLVWPPRLKPGGAARTMADRAACLDPAVRAGDVLAVAVAVERGGRLVSARRRATAARSLLRAVWAKLRGRWATREAHSAGGRQAAASPPGRAPEPAP